MSLQDTPAIHPADTLDLIRDTLPIPGHPSWCRGCDIGDLPADPAAAARTVALITHDSWHTFGTTGLGLARTDSIEVDAAGSLVLVPGELRVFITPDGPSVTLDQARATAEALPAMLAALDTVTTG